MSALNQLLASYAAASAAGFPVLLDITPTPAAFSSTTHNIGMPATVAAGDLLIAVVAATTASAILVAAVGWTVIYSSLVSPVSTAILYKVAAGTEGGTVVDFSTPASVPMCGSVFRIAATSYSGTPEATRASGGSSVAPDSPNLTASWGALNTKWIVGFTMQTLRTVTSYPYATDQTVSTGPNAPWLASCTTEVNAASLNPAAFALGGTSNWESFIIAIRPA